MKYTGEIPMAATNAGYKLYVVEQSTAGAVAENDTISFPNTTITDCFVITMRSATGQIMNFDTAADVAATGSAPKYARFTVDHQDAATNKHVFGTLATGALATSVRGLVLARKIAT